MNGRNEGWTWLAIMSIVVISVCAAIISYNLPDVVYKTKIVKVIEKVPVLVEKQIILEKIQTVPVTTQEITKNYITQQVDVSNMSECVRIKSDKGISIHCKQE